MAQHKTFDVDQATHPTYAAKKNHFQTKWHRVLNRNECNEATDEVKRAYNLDGVATAEDSKADQTAPLDKIDPSKMPAGADVQVTEQDYLTAKKQGQNDTAVVSLLHIKDKQFQSKTQMVFFKIKGVEHALTLDPVNGVTELEGQTLEDFKKEVFDAEGKPLLGVTAEVHKEGVDARALYFEKPKPQVKLAR